MTIEGFVVGMVVAGLAVLGVVVLPRVVSERAVSLPIVYLAFGAAVFSVVPTLPAPDPIEHADVAERLTELGVIVALMGAGLKLDRRLAWPAWASTARLLGVTMPLSIGLAALVGLWAELLLPTALLLGAVIAPTDPVLASEVQVPKPGEGMEAEPRPGRAGMEDEVRFALTSEAGLNDGLAFPFTYLAILVALAGYDPAAWAGEWALVYVAYKIVAGVALGVGLGWLVAAVTFEVAAESPLSQSLRGLEAVAGTLLVYGVVELLGGYGFIGVFVAALAMRQYERRHEYHEELHSVAEMGEYLLMAAIVMLFGGALADGLLAPLTPRLAAAGLAIVFLVRPLAGAVGLLGFDRDWRERSVIAFFGIRGIGSFYYLSYGLNNAPFRDGDELWALVGFVVLVSIVVHGVAASPAIAWLEEAIEDA